MNKELTAMQILIENIDARLSTDPSNSLMYALETVKIEAISLLQKEQEQIEQAFDAGYSDAFDNTQYITTNYYQSKYGGEDAD